jgi:hypothetical protein
MTDSHASPSESFSSLPATMIAAKLEHLIARGVIGADCTDTRPLASGRPRVRPIRSVSAYVSEHRRLPVTAYDPQAARGLPSAARRYGPSG